MTEKPSEPIAYTDAAIFIDQYFDSPDEFWTAAARAGISKTAELRLGINEGYVSAALTCLIYNLTKQHQQRNIFPIQTRTHEVYIPSQRIIMHDIVDSLSDAELIALTQRCQ